MGVGVSLMRPRFLWSFSALARGAPAVAGIGDWDGASLTQLTWPPGPRTWRALRSLELHERPAGKDVMSLRPSQSEGRAGRHGKTPSELLPCACAWRSRLIWLSGRVVVDGPLAAVMKVQPWAPWGLGEVLTHRLRPTAATKTSGWGQRTR